MADVRCSTSVEAAPGDRLKPEEVQAWIVDVPPQAELAPILRETGHQRDPITILAGLRASWVEER